MTSARTRTHTCRPARSRPARSRVWEFNDEGSIPYVPWLRAPYYVWVGRVPKLETLLVENKVRTSGSARGWGRGGRAWGRERGAPRASEGNVQA